MKKLNIKKIGASLKDILLWAFVVLCAFSVLITLLSKKDDGAAELFGYQMRIITSESMEKCDETDVSGYDIGSLPLRTMVFVKTVPNDEKKANEWYGDLKVGDVLTFKYRYDTQVTITHRITAITEKQSGGYVIELAGDNKSSDENLLVQVIDTSLTDSPNYVIGKVTGKSFLLGLIVSLLKTTLGIVLIVIVPCLIIITLEIIKIVGMYQGERKKREREESEKKDSEIEELKKRLAELEKRSDGDVGNADKN